MISAYDYRRIFAYEVDDLRGIWPIVHQVSQNPKLIEVGRRRADSLKIGVKIRNDKHFHRFIRPLQRCHWILLQRSSLAAILGSGGGVRQTVALKAANDSYGKNCCRGFRRILYS